MALALLRTCDLARANPPVGETDSNPVFPLRQPVRSPAASLADASWVKMEDLIHDLPLAIDFEHREQVGEPVAGPVVEFQPHGSDGVDDVDASDPCLEPRRR